MGKQERRESPVHLLRCMDLNSILTSDKGALPYQSAHTRIHTASLLCLACSSDPSPCADPLKGIDFGTNFDDEEKEPPARIDRMLACNLTLCCASGVKFLPSQRLESSTRLGCSISSRVVLCQNEPHCTPRRLVARRGLC